MTKRLLISGVPGTGKTTLGRHLAERGFVHVDMEKNDFAGAKKMLASVDSEVKLLSGLRGRHGVVVTWGFDPHRGYTAVKSLMEAGFAPFWLDGRRDLCFKSFMDREQHNEDMELAFYEQVASIIKTRISSTLPWNIVNVFSENEQFHYCYEIADRILESLEDDECATQMS